MKKLKYLEVALVKQYPRKKRSFNYAKAIQVFLLIGFTIVYTAKAQLVSVAVTGFNNDIVANGVGFNSIPGTTYPSIGMDGAGYTFIDNTYKYSSSSSLPTCFLPVNQTLTSLRTPGLNYSLQSYTGFNSMTIDNDNTAYLTSPFAKTGTLTLATPASYSKLFVLYESVMYISPMSVDVTVTFTDASTQVFNGNTCVNWFTATLPACNHVGRTSPGGTVECGFSPNFYPNLFELQLTLSAANYNKQVQSITFTLPAVYTTGTTPDKVNYFHAIAVGGNTAPLAVHSEKVVDLSIQVFPNPAANSISFEIESTEVGSSLEIVNLMGKSCGKLKMENPILNLNLDSFTNGVYFYKLTNKEGSSNSGKFTICR